MYRTEKMLKTCNPVTLSMGNSWPLRRFFAEEFMMQTTTIRGAVDHVELKGLSWRGGDVSTKTNPYGRSYA